jgi:hypothetical protein
VLFLDKDSDQVVVLGREGHLLKAHDSSYSVYPLERRAIAYSLATDPSPVWKRLGNATRFQGMLEMMVFLLVRLMTWEFIPSAEKLFHSQSSRSHKSLILVQSALAMVRPSLSLLTPKGWPVGLVTKGLLKIGCLRTSTWEVGLVFTRLALTFNQDPIILFQKEQVVFWSLGAAKSQLMSWFLGPLPWTRS